MTTKKTKKRASGHVLFNDWDNAPHTALKKPYDRLSHYFGHRADKIRDMTRQDALDKLDLLIKEFKDRPWIVQAFKEAKERIYRGEYTFKEDKFKMEQRNIPLG